MNGWMLSGGAMALVCTLGHAMTGRRMFYHPIKSAIANATQSGVFTGMWHLITINFALSAAALLVAGASGGRAALAWLIAAQFAGYALAYLVISEARSRSSSGCP